MWLTDPTVPLDDVRQLAELYFPADPAAPSSRLFCRAVRGEYAHDAASIRDTVLEWMWTTKDDHRCISTLLVGRLSGKKLNLGRPTIMSLTRKRNGGMSVIARNILVEAERVYKDLQAMQGLFPGLLELQPEQAAPESVSIACPPMRSPCLPPGSGADGSQIAQDAVAAVPLRVAVADPEHRSATRLPQDPVAMQTADGTPSARPKKEPPPKSALHRRRTIEHR